ncbi:hypothetical protein WKH56_06535 [Priestia sp. SB1]|uniref:Uncharacterized protein n=1 Tax=Priestia aryabhattai TaxID=412384 RepID=A0AAX6NC25_PRIAR|nr:hypothetical protein [Priestia aryabhattai]MDU9693359.1 hypothetical protein [Priestia aryabhattai]
MYSDNIEFQQYQEKIHKKQHIGKVENYFEMLKASKKKVTDKNVGLRISEIDYDSLNDNEISFKSRRELKVPETLNGIELDELKSQVTEDIMKLDNNKLLQKLMLLKG